MAAVKKKIAVVGGGFSGVGAIAMLKEEGFEPICFEKTDKVGGTWCYREKSEVGLPSIFPTTIINHSKELGALSDFPPDKKYSNYMKHNELYEIFLSYCNHKDVLKHIQCNSEVTEVKKAADYDETGQWIVTVNNTITGIVSSETYDVVLICVGNMTVPVYPHPYPGQEIFKGQITHTHFLKSVESYKNKKVAVVGMGCSGLDGCVDLTTVAEKVYLSTRSGAFVFNRVGPGGYPIDYCLLRRYITFFFDLVPRNIISWIVENMVLDQNFNSRLYFVQPKWHALSKDPVVNDHISSKLLSGSVIQKGDIKNFTENGIVFEGEDSITEIDAVIFATGLTNQFPFLAEYVLQDGEKSLNLYKCIWPPYLKHPTLGFLGFFLPCGPGFPLGEMQSRYVAQVVAGKIKLPSTKDMVQDITMRLKKNSARFIPNAKLPFRVDYVQYLDELATIIGVKPNFLKMFFRDPKLFCKLIFGPSLPYQYRLEGPHSWSGAREAIMTCEERIHYPLKQANVGKIESSFLIFIKKFFRWLLPFA